MSVIVEIGKILRNEQIGNDVWLMDIEAPQQAQVAQIGQFCNIAVPNDSSRILRRPISYANFDSQRGTVTFLIRAIGEGTKRIVEANVGDSLEVLGPLGKPFTTSSYMMLVGGGVGIAPMLAMASHLPEGTQAEVVLGFRNASELFWADLFNDLPVKVHITTDDGSAGTKGFPTTIMPRLLNTERFTSVHTCGPMPMMKGVAKTAAAFDVYCEVSLEERMGCGTGGCLGCSISSTDGKRYKVCKDGPVFAATEVFIP